MNGQIENQQRVERRRKIFVDSDIQSALLKQLAISWLTVLGVIACVLLAVESYKADFALTFFGCVTAMWSHNAALAITLCVLAPIIIYDALKLSHRFVGPMVCFRRALTRLGEGEQVEPMRFRKDDFWKDLAERFNHVVERIDRLEAARVEGRVESSTHDASTIEPAPTA